MLAFFLPLLLIRWTMGRKHAVDSIPGPPSFPLVGTMWQFAKGRHVAWKLMKEYAVTYFPIYRTWQGPWPVVHPLDPSQVEVILSSNTHITKGYDYDLVKPWLGDGLLISTGAKWHKRRKLLTPAFHFRILEQFLPVFCDKTEIFVSRLKKHVGRKEGVNLVPLVTRCALDIICETAMGTNINAQSDQDSEYVSAIYEISDLVFHRAMTPWLYSDFIFKFSSNGRKQAACLKILHGFTMKVITDRRQELRRQGITNSNNTENFGLKRKMAFLDLLLLASENDPSLTDEDIRQEVDTFMFEGHDTTAMAMSWAFFFLGRHEHVQSKCVEELENIFSGDTRSPNLADLSEMKYLERVIKETLRLRPSVPNINRTLHQEAKLGPYEIPVGTKVTVHIHDVHRNPKIFPNPEQFDPDRFLPEQVQGRHPYAYVPFSAGPRNCIGQKFAMLEMKEVISTVLRNFRLEVIHPEHHYQEMIDLVIRPANGIKVKLTQRN